MIWVIDQTLLCFKEKDSETERKRERVNVAEKRQNAKALKCFDDYQSMHEDKSMMFVAGCDIKYKMMKLTKSKTWGVKSFVGCNRKCI